MAFLGLESWLRQHWILSELDNVMIRLCFITHVLLSIFLVPAPPLLLHLFRFPFLFSSWAGDF